MEILVHLNFDLLAVANDIITAEGVCLLGFADDENGSADWAWMLGSGSRDVSFIDSERFGAQIGDHITLHLLVGDDNVITISQNLVLAGKRPCDLAGLLSDSGESLVEVESLIGLSLIVVN